MEKTNSPDHHISKDGSSTLYSQQFGQYYHNPNGAISESKQVFFETSGLLETFETDSKSVSIFEVGFGTGLNFLLLLDYYLRKNLSIPVHFYSVEAFPINEKKAALLNFSKLLENEKLDNILTNIFNQLKSGKNVFTPIPEKDIHLHLFYGTFKELEPLETSVDFIFQDAFSPEVNRELWSYEAFEKLASFSSEHTVLTTYCASSKARAAMAKANWFIAKTRGALGKREMTIASLSENKLTDFKRVNEKRLIERWDNNEFKDDQ